MRISIRTKKRRMTIVTGDDALAEEVLEFVQLGSADLTPAAQMEQQEEYEEDATPAFGFH